MSSLQKSRSNPETPPIDPSGPNKVSTAGQLDVRQAIVPTGLDSGAITRVDDGRLAAVAAQVELNPVESPLPPMIPDPQEWRRPNAASVVPSAEEKSTELSPKLQAELQVAATDPQPGQKGLRQWWKVIAAGILMSLLAVAGFAIFLQYAQPSRVRPIANAPTKANKDDSALPQDSTPPVVPADADKPPENSDEASSKLPTEPSNPSTETPDAADPKEPPIIESDAASNQPADQNKKPVIKKPLTGLALDSKEEMKNEPKEPLENLDPKADEIPEFMRKLGPYFDRGDVTLQPDASTSEVPTQSLKTMLRWMSLLSIIQPRLRLLFGMMSRHSEFLDWLRRIND